MVDTPNTLPTLTRAQLAEVFKDPRTLLAFERIQQQALTVLPATTTSFQALDFVLLNADPSAPNAVIIMAGPGLKLTTPAGEVVLGLNTSGVTAGAYTNASITVDTFGRITAASSGAAGVLSFSAGTTGLTPSSPVAGAVVLGGTLNVANGGTGSATAPAARTALGLGGAAVLNVGAVTGTVAAGDDPRFANAKPNYATVATDADFTITRQASVTIVRHTGTLTANRAVTLSTTGAVAGDQVLLTRTGSGAFNLTIAGKALITNTWAAATYDGAAWYLSSYGSL